MSYTKKTWTTGDVITADAMNNLEEGASLQPDYAQTDSTQPDYIKNKLVGQEVTYSDTLTWDGNTDGLENVEGMVYHVSDAVPVFSDFSNGCTILFLNNNGTIEETCNLTSDNFQATEDGFIASISMFIHIIPSDNYTHAEMGVTFPKKGIYFLYDEGNHVTSFTIPGYTGFPTTTTKKLTAEYLEPFEVVTKGGDTLTWDGDTSGKEFVDIGIPLYHVSDVVPTLGDLANGFTIIYNEKNSLSISFTSENITTIMDGLLLCGADADMILICASDNMEADGIVIPKKGIYMPAYDGSVGSESSWVYISSLTIPGYTGFTTTEKKLKGEYVIDTNSIILKSSGGKRFKVTVSDTGTLTATEI